MLQVAAVQILLVASQLTCLAVKVLWRIERNNAGGRSVSTLVEWV